MASASTSPAADQAESSADEAPALDLSGLADSKEATVQPSIAAIPDEVKSFVEAGHKHWKDAPKVWREVELATEDAVKSVKKMAAKFARQTGRTFRVSSQPNAKKLVYKVTDAVSHSTNGSGESTAPAED